MCVIARCMSQILNRCILFSILYFRLCRRKAAGLSLPVLADGVVHGAHVVPRLALQVHPVVPVLPREGEAVLVVHVVRFSLVPGGVVPDKERVSQSLVREIVTRRRHSPTARSPRLEIGELVLRFRLRRGSYRRSPLLPASSCW